MSAINSSTLLKNIKIKVLKLTEEEAKDIAEQVMIDLGIWESGMGELEARCHPNGDAGLLGEKIPTWLVSCVYREDDFLDGKCYMMCLINDNREVAEAISFRHGHIELGYNPFEALYFNANPVVD